MKKLTYVALYKDGTWGLVYHYDPVRYSILPDEHKVSRSNNSTKAVKNKVSTYLLGRQTDLQSRWIKDTQWTRERLLDCLDNPHKYKRKGIRRR